MNQTLYRAFRYIFKGVPSVDVRAEISYLNPDAKLAGKRIVITGGGKGIGKAIAERFVKEGADVLIAGRNEKVLNETSVNIGCKYLRLDVSDINSFDKFLSEAYRVLGGIDILVNNAGISLHENNLFEVTPETFDSQFNTNFRGPFFLTQNFIKRNIDANHKASVLFITSETGDTVDFRPYGLTKSLLNNWVQGIANLFKEKGIRVNALAPGITASEMTGVKADSNLNAGNYGSGRFYLPEEMAEVACFLCSDAANIISGQIITCNNAQTVNARWK